jgi:hypothetical protein
LLDDAHQIHRLLDNFEVQFVPFTKSVDRPAGKPPISFLGRMCRSGDKKLAYYKEALVELDAKAKQIHTGHGIFDRIESQYKDKNFVPRVHAEIQVLEHFHTRNDLKFAGNDRFIACSKLACYCCHLYFRNHPARPVEPGTHQKIWLNWGPPRSAYYFNDASGKRQRDIMNKMLLIIRRDALSDIERQEYNHRWHADSHTGITTSVQMESHRDQMEQESSSDGSDLDGEG